MAELVARAQEGCEQAFEELYRGHVGSVYGICLRMVADAAQAEILTQDVFVRAWQKLRTYAGRGAFGGWLRRITVNVVIEDRRAFARDAKWMDFDYEIGERDETGAVAPPQTETAIDLERAIAALPPRARMAFVLHDVYGYRHREMAEMAGVAVGTMKAHLHRARLLLRERLGKEGEAAR
jgi:RNA polymerase sigma-70 factor (ECF subfamily)